MAAPKTCRSCGESKPLADFPRHPEMGDGHLNKCKACVADYNRERSLDPEVRAADRNRLSLWRAANPEKWREYRRATYAKRQADGQQNAVRQRRRLREQAAQLGYKEVDLQAILDRDGRVCHICVFLSAPDPAIGPRDLNFDHIVPLSRGGPHTFDNLAPAHKRCNSWKHNRRLEELVGAAPPGSDADAERREQLRKAAWRDSIRRRYDRSTWTDEQKVEWAERVKARAAKRWGGHEKPTPPAVAGSEEHRKKLSVGQRRRRQGEKEAGMSLGNLENLRKGWDPQVRARAIAKSAEMRKGKPLTPKHKAKTLEAQKRAVVISAELRRGSTQTPESNAKRAEAMRQRWAEGKFADRKPKNT